MHTHTHTHKHTYMHTQAPMHLQAPRDQDQDQAPPPLPRGAALFLDFDGTLVALARAPNAIEVPAGLVPLLAGLQAWLGGALAIVTGRQIEVLDGWISPLRLPAAGEHGLQRRDAGARMLRQAAPVCAQVLHACHALAARHPGLLVEPKYSAVALHYRQAPGLQALCHDTLARLVQDRPGLQLLQGHCVLEIKPVGHCKGSAIRDFLREPPFAGRQAVFVGDDATDETGFEAVQSQAGLAVKVGCGPSAARHRLDSPQAVLQWLAASLPRPAHP